MLFRRKVLPLVAGVTILLAVYIFQKMDIFGMVASATGLSNVHRYWHFGFNKALRMAMNDGACLLIIYGLFQNRDYVRVAFYLFLAELFLFLPVYLLFKLTLEGDSELSSPLLSQIHRLIVNPVLMFLLMVGFYYQEQKQRRA